MMSAPPMGERPGGSSWASAAATPGRPTPFHSAVTTAAQHSASTFVASGSRRAALALRQRHIEARAEIASKHLAQDAEAELNAGCKQPSGRSAFGNARSRRQGASATGRPPAPCLPRRAGDITPVVTAVEPQARVRRACVRAAPHVADGACCAGAGGVAFRGSQRRGFRWRGRSQ
jgi:hypothetical protein